MNTIKLAACACLLFSVCLGTSVVTAQSNELSLREAMQKVLAEHPQFRIYQLNKEALAGEAQSAALKPAIQVNANVENFLGTGDLNGLHGSEWTLSLSRVIEQKEKRTARTDVVRHRQALLDAEQQIRELDLLSATAKRYIEFTAAMSRLQVLQRATDLAATTRDEIAQRVSAGRTPEAELTRARANLARAELAVESAQLDVNASRLHLASYWGDFQPAQFTSTADLFRLAALPDIEELLDLLVENPAVTVFVSRSRLREAELHLAQSHQLTNYTVGAGIKHLAELNDTAFVAEFSMPLNSRERARGAITTAQAKLLQVDAEQEAALWQMKGRLLALDQQRRAALMRHDQLRDDIIPLLQQAYDSTFAAYETGLYSFIEVSSAQRALLEAELARIDAATQSHLLRIEIERLSGNFYDDATAPTGGNQ